jgi:hypothetical protein
MPTVSVFWALAVGSLFNLGDSDRNLTQLVFAVAVPCYCAVVAKLSFRTEHAVLAITIRWS